LSRWILTNFCNVLLHLHIGILGLYSFTDQTGIPVTGNFTVVIVVPQWVHQTTANPPTIDLSRGALDFDGVNFGIDF
jgi:hypothetical protein